jgi:hypothetical protein
LKGRPDASSFLAAAGKTGVICCCKDGPCVSVRICSNLVISHLLLTLADRMFTDVTAATGLMPALQNANATITVLVPTNSAFQNLTPAALNISDTDSLRLVSSYMWYCRRCAVQLNPKIM